MKKFPLIEQMGLSIFKADVEKRKSGLGLTWQGYVVTAEDIEKALSEAHKIELRKSQLCNGKTGECHDVYEMVDMDKCTHEARIICIQPIKREPVKVEFNLDCTVFDPEVAFDNSRWGAPRSKVNQLKKKRWKITAEEITEEKEQSRG